MRQGLEETGMGYGLEVEMIRLAREMDLLTTPYAFTEQEARDMATAGADLAHSAYGPNHERYHLRSAQP
jgi:predicted TIM-barrel enzyme